MVRIALTGASRKALGERLQQAYATDATRLIRRIHALLGLAEGQSVYEMAQLLGVGEQHPDGTRRDWRHAFVLNGPASLFYQARPGRRPKLTSAQRQELRQLLVDGPEAAGYTSACWTAGMIADLIHRRVHVDYAPRFVCHLLDALGFSYRKGKFSADHVDDEAAIAWLEQTWPEILRVAQEKHALILFGDEASFAQWGSLGDT